MMSRTVIFKKIVFVTLIVMMAVITVQCSVPPAEPLVQTVEVERVVEKEVIVEKEVPVTVEKEVIVEVEREVPVAKEIVTIAYNGYFDMTFGPADTPITVIREEVAKKYPNIEVRFNIMPFEATPWRDNYLAWSMAGDGMTDLIGMGLYWLPEFASIGWLMPLQDVISPEILAELNPAYKESFTYNGDLLALGPWWGGIGGLYYREDLLDEAGFPPPQTYGELLEIAQAITTTYPELDAWTWPALKDQVLVNRWVEFLNGFGGEYFDDGGRCVMNDEKGVEALEFMISLFDQGITPQEALTWKEEESQVRFVSGRSIFHTGRQDMMFWLDDPDQSNIAGKWGFIPMPGKDGVGAGFFEGWGFSINKNSNNPEAAAKVLEVMFDFPVQKAFNLSQGPVQAHMMVYSDPDVLANNPNMALVEAVADTAIPPIPSPNFAEISAILYTELHSALTGSISAQAALNAACAEIDRID
jgi:multiple sugar transport system substrate-binding protein